MSNTHPATRIGVTLLFLVLYVSFLLETGALLMEFRGTGLGVRLASLDSQNFVFFPIAGLLALVAFWKPAVFLIDGLARGQLMFGRPVLAGGTIICVLAAWALAAAFSSSPARSIFEVSPSALMQDEGMPASGNSPALVPVPEVLARMKILSASEGGLSSFRAACDPEWLRYSTEAHEQKLCFPAGGSVTVAECCQAKAAFRAHVNRMAQASPSNLAGIHNLVLPVKCFFLLLLLFIGILLVQYRKGLERLHGEMSGVSFGLAVGGAVMLIWPLLNASYLETIALLTGGTSSSAYSVTAPLIALGFGAWTLLLVFFHLRAYPSQIEYAAKVGGFIAAAIGVFRYDEITTYLSRTLGVGGSVVAIIVFAVAVIALLLSILMGIDPTDINFDEEEEPDAGEDTAEFAARAEKDA